MSASVGCKPQVVNIMAITWAITVDVVRFALYKGRRSKHDRVQFRVMCACKQSADGRDERGRKGSAEKRGRPRWE